MQDTPDRRQASLEEPAVERVLCCHRVEAAGFLPPGSIPIEDLDVFFVDRNRAEYNEELHQLIPYLVVRNHTGRILTYRRTETGGEDRLHNLYAIGIGGHVNPKDAAVDDSDRPGVGIILRRGMKRELLEELALDLDKDVVSLELAGFVASNETAVSRVHLGIVYTLTLEPGAEEGISREETLAELEFVSPPDLLQRQLEDWSRLVIAGLFSLK